MFGWVRRLGCLGSILFALGIMAGVYALLVPWSFHIGGRWTWTTSWSGVGELRDAQGMRYGLYLFFAPDIRRGSGPHVGQAHPTPAVTLRGNATVCTSRGPKYPLGLYGTIYGAWADAEGKEIALDLREPRNSKPRRHFELDGAFRGSELPMDDQKTMFMYLMPDGYLTPARSYTSPVPEKHAKVTLTWGDATDFDRLCAAVAGGK
jgi:hypothetical protein